MQDNIFSYIDEGVFNEPIKNPFSSEAEYEQAIKDVKGIIKVNEEVSNDTTVEQEMLKYLYNIGCEYI